MDISGKGVAVAILAGVSITLDKYGATVACATVGACWALAKVPTPTRWQAATMLLRWVMVSVVFTGLATALVTKHVGVDADLARGPVAFILAFWGDRWMQVPALMSALVKRLLPEKKSHE